MGSNINDISEKDKAYFAGLFDGEGCVLIHKTTYTERKTTYRLSVNFGITYASVLYEMKSIFGGSVYKDDMIKVKNRSSIDPERYDMKNWKQIYRYTLSGKDAWVFLKIIESNCREKKEQVHLSIEFFNGYICKRGGSGGMSKSQIERCEYYYKKLQDLKKENCEDNNVYINFKDLQKTLSFSSEK